MHLCFTDYLNQLLWYENRNYLQNRLYIFYEFVQHLAQQSCSHKRKPEINKLWSFRRYFVHVFSHLRVSVKT